MPRHLLLICAIVCAVAITACGDTESPAPQTTKNERGYRIEQTGRAVTVFDTTGNLAERIHWSTLVDAAVRRCQGPVEAMQEVARNGYSVAIVVICARPGVE